MRVTIRENTYIRASPQDLGAPLGILFAGTEVEVEPETHPGGLPANNNGLPVSNWYKDAGNPWYYWAGSVEKSVPARVAPDYQKRLSLPESWIELGGQGVKVGILDTGFDLQHPALAHLNRPGHTYNLSGVGRTKAYSGNGNDNIAPDQPNDYHGSECAAILAGLAPQAEVFLFKVRENRLLQLLEALKIAQAQGIRLFSVSLAYDDIYKQGEDFAELRELFSSLLPTLSGNILVLSTLNNPDAQLDSLNQVPFPASWKPISLSVGAIQRPFLDKFPQKPQLASEIDLLTYCGTPFEVIAPGGKMQEVHFTSSYATPLIAAAFALGASFLKSMQDSGSLSLGAIFQTMAQDVVSYGQIAQRRNNAKVLLINPKA